MSSATVWTRPVDLVELAITSPQREVFFRAVVLLLLLVPLVIGAVLIVRSLLPGAPTTQLAPYGIGNGARRRSRVGDAPAAQVLHGANTDRPNGVNGAKNTGSSNNASTRASSSGSRSTSSGSTASHKLTSSARARSIWPRFPSSPHYEDILPCTQP